MFVVLLLSLPLLAIAHDHGETTPEMMDPSMPIDALLWLHIAVQASVWCILWPIGLVLGITRSRWHVPLQATGFLLTTGGYILGHVHEGRAFPTSFHSKLAPLLLFPLVLQLSLGIYLKLHIHEKTLRPYAVVAHRWVAYTYPVIGFTQALLGVLVLLGACIPESADAMPMVARPLVTCLQTIGTSIGLVMYGVINYISLAKSGTKRSDWIDSLSILIGGAIMLAAGLFYKEVNQASLGLFWTLGGALGVMVSGGRTRNIIPGAIIMITGIASSLRTHTGSSGNELEAVAHLESAFSYTLALAGLARIIEICFTIPMASPRNVDASSPTENPWQHATPFLLILSGLSFLVSHQEQAKFLAALGLQSSSVLFLTMSIALSLYGFLILLTHLHATTGRNATNIPRVHEASEVPLRRAPIVDASIPMKGLYTLTSGSGSDFGEDDRHTR